jgi:hypothetical protein
MVKPSDIDFHHYHLRELPILLVARGGNAALLARELAAVCLRLRGSDNAYSYRPQAFTIEIVAGTEADTVIELSLADWQALVAGEKLGPALFEFRGANNMFIDDGDYFNRWQLVIAAMYHGQ